MNIYLFAFLVTLEICIGVYVVARIRSATATRMRISPVQLAMFCKTLRKGNVHVFYNEKLCRISHFVFQHKVAFFRLRVLFLTFVAVYGIILSRNQEFIYALGALEYALLFMMLSIFLDVIVLQPHMEAAVSALMDGDPDRIRINREKGLVEFIGQDSTVSCPALLGSDCMYNEDIDVYLGFGPLGRRFALCAVRKVDFYGEDL